MDLSDYKLVWSDEFDGNELDNTKWSLSGDDQTKNNVKDKLALVFEDDEKVIKVEDSSLKLKAYYDWEKNYFVAPKSVYTKNNMSYKYGYLEVRAKIPFSRGNVISMNAVAKDAIGAEKDAPYYSSMNIFNYAGFVYLITNAIIKNYENYDENNPFYQEGTDNTDSSFTAQRWGLNTADSFHTRYTTDVLDDFKTYGFLWTPDEVVFTVDGYTITRMSLKQDFLRPSGMEGFRQPHYLAFKRKFIINERSPECWVRPEELAKQVDFEIDYVRLYQKDGEGELNLK